MKRRSFLTMLGAAVATPVVPVAAPALPAAAPEVAALYNRYTYGVAVFHARTSAHVSVRGLRHGLKVTTAQAQALMAEMTAGGHVSPVAGLAGHARAVSSITRTDGWRAGVVRHAAENRARIAQLAEETDSAPDHPHHGFVAPDLSHMMAHLHAISSRFFAAQAA